MKLLIIGGTRFVGRHMVEEALKRGYTITLFNRGNAAEVFPELEQLKGDRNTSLDVLKGRVWDAVIDTCGYLPSQVEAAARLLKDAVNHYTFISTVSVYEDLIKPLQADPIWEDSNLLRLKEPTDQVTNESYGPLKVLCEEAAEVAMPGRTLVIRPGFIIGPYDPTDRFTYWPYRVAQGGEMLAPGKPKTFIQHIDARDLAAFTLSAIERELVGVLNTVTPIGAHSMQDLLETSRRVSSSDTRLTWVDEDFLEAHDVLDHLTIWPPTAYANFVRASSERAVAAGLRFRSLEETVRDTLAWTKTLASDYQLKAGLTREREKELLELWHTRA